MGGHGCSPYSSSTMDLGKLGFAEIEEFSGGEVQGRSDGGIWVYIPPKSVQVNFLLVKMTSERLLNSFIPPHPKKTFILPKQISGYAPGEVGWRP